MPDYKQMYTDLFQSQTEAINILQAAQRKTEGMFIEGVPPENKNLDGRKDNADE